jgi:hypothetical protein
MYDSLIDSSSYQWSMAMSGGTGSQFGNEITLTNPTNALLSSVVVELANFNANATVTPAITLSIYKAPALGGSVTSGDLIASATQTFTIPGTPTGYAATTSDPYFGIENTPVTFNQFTYPAAAAGFATPLPSTVVFEISYLDATGKGVNVDMSSGNSPDQITVGSDPHLGYLFASTTDGTGGFFGGANGEITCSTVNSTFTEYSTAVGTNGCGMDNYSGQQLYSIPAVEFNTSAGTLSGLYPGGSAQTIDFTVTNPGPNTEALNAVTIKVASDPANGEVESTPYDTSTDVTGCYASWFTTAGETFNGSLTSGQSVSGSGSISMPASTSDQDPCQGVSLGLIFGSN